MSLLRNKVGLTLDFDSMQTFMVDIQRTKGGLQHGTKFSKIWLERVQLFFKPLPTTSLSFANRDTASNSSVGLMSNWAVEAGGTALRDGLKVPISC